MKLLDNALSWVRRNHTALILIVLGLVLVFGATQWLTPFKIGLGPEFILKAFGKIFYLGVAFGATMYIIRKLCPSIDEFCSRQSLGDSASEFARVFKNDPRDPRIWHAVFAHVGVFLAVCLILALAF